MNAEAYLNKQLNIVPEYNLLILFKADWKKYAHPQAVYGIPHFLEDGRLVVAAEDNDFWKPIIPPLHLLPEDLAHQFKQTYSNDNGEFSFQAGFNLLAIHELGHSFQKEAKMIKQSNWLNEFIYNLLLHTFIAEEIPSHLPELTLLPKGIIASIDPKNLL